MTFAVSTLSILLENFLFTLDNNQVNEVPSSGRPGSLYKGPTVLQFEEISGYLKKQGNNMRKDWKKRWFVLKPDTLNYYKSEKVCNS